MGSNTILPFFLLLSMGLRCEAYGTRGGTMRNLHELQRPTEMPSSTPVKTITTDDGDVIDCVHIYSQPSLQHASLKDHVVKMQPTSYPDGGINSTNSSSGTSRQWNKEGEHCPEWTVPLARNVNHSLETVSLLGAAAAQVNSAGLNDAAFTGLYQHEFAYLRTDYPPDYGFFGASARLNVWNPLTRDGEFSSSTVAVLGDKEYISAGWIVYNKLFGDYSTRLFIFYKGTNRMCYNYSPSCPGFVHVNHQVGLGVKIQPDSKYGGQQYGVDIQIFKDPRTHDWWFRFQGKDVGYWPSSLFTSLRNWASSVHYGGEITDQKFQGFHTTTRMGSGNWPSEGFGKAAYISNIAYINGDNSIKTLRHYVPIVTNSGCYALEVFESRNMGLHIYYGGPGNSADRCPH